MRHNGRPVVLASAIRPDHLNLRPGEVRTVLCPDCRRVRRLTRGMICAHSDERRADRGEWARCPGSGQRICMDLTPARWARALADRQETWSASLIDPDTRAPRLSPRALVSIPVVEAPSVPVGPGWLLVEEFTAATDHTRIRGYTAR